MMNIFSKSMVLICMMSVFTVAHSQKGMGESEGLSSKGTKAELVTLKGTVKEIKKGPCTFTTGKSTSGTHLLVTSNGTMFNVHLGPTKKVYNFVADSDGDQIEIVAFRTVKLPKDHYIAKELVYNGNELVLRDKNLKPFWAKNRGQGVWK
ncbi:hypothetical protein [Flagellimonas sp. S3867]|uniref:hypothetical protein n=1 Tax=Flagellimonas sp. S3867 TaxID=2768063 RepID=UPI001681F0E1|nr:hypothetical protein [Flagellimonas sp. S3867]